jgi:hypothetical protein
MTFHMKPRGMPVHPKTGRDPAPAAALVVTLGPPVQIPAQYRQLAGEWVRDVRDARLRPIQVVDFFPPQGGFGGSR